MSRKVIIDCDPGIDDLVALCLALFEPKLEVVAVTATAGNVAAEQSSLNVQAIIERLDPPRLPRIGVASVEHLAAYEARRHHGIDGLGGADLPVSQLHHPHPSEKVICDAVHANPDEVTIIALGPLTNIARAFQRDPDLATKVDRVLMMGGCQPGQGNVTAAAEFNIYCDPESAQTVFRSPTTKRLIPLDVTRKVVFNLDLLEQLPSASTPVGALLRKVMPHAFRTHRQQLAMEGIMLSDAVTIMAVIDSNLFTMEDRVADVEVTGDLTIGATIFDQRPNTKNLPNMEVAVDVDAAKVARAIVSGLSRAAG